VSSIVIQGDTSGSITVEAPSVAGTHTLTLPKVTGNIATDATVGLGTKNLIINGDMRIAQRGTSGAFGSGAAFITDRWRHYFDTAVTGNITISQSSVAPSNFDYSHLLTNGTATSPASGNFNGCTQRIEGNNVAHLAFGTSDAKTVTLSFWVRSSLTGTFGIALGNGAQNRVMTKTYTISSANTWEYKTLTFVGDTSGTWEKNNTAGMIVYYDVGSGSGEETATLDTWNSTRAIRTSACVRLIENTGATWQITGVQLEVGENATPFEHRPYDMELARCQRYLEYSGLIGNSAYASTGATYSCMNTWHFATQKRATPTVTRTTNATTISGIDQPISIQQDLECTVITGVGTANNRSYYLDAEFKAESEL